MSKTPQCTSVLTQNRFSWACECPVMHALSRPIHLSNVLRVGTRVPSRRWGFSWGRMWQCHDHSEFTEHTLSNYLLLSYLVSKLSTGNLLSTGNPIQTSERSLPRNLQRRSYAMTFRWERALRKQREWYGSLATNRELLWELSAPGLCQGLLLYHLQ